MNQATDAYLSLPVEVVDYEGGKRLVAATDCGPSHDLFSMVLVPANLKPTPTYTSIQVGPNQHVECGERLRYMDHSFQPTARIVVTMWTLRVVSLKSIKRGDPITFDYNTTEDVMAQPFQDYATGKMVAGWSALSLEDKADISHMAAPGLK